MPLAREVKYIANRPAKNINSWDRNTIVPTLTIFGRFSAATRGGAEMKRWLLALERRHLDESARGPVLGG